MPMLALNMAAIAPAVRGVECMMASRGGAQWWIYCLNRAGGDVEWALSRERGRLDVGAHDAGRFGRLATPAPPGSRWPGR
jgi:hypothetical protein